METVLTASIGRFGSFPTGCARNLRREWYSSGAGERGGEAGEDAEVGVKLDLREAADAKRRSVPDDLRQDTSGTWDYVCTEATTGTVLEIDVNPSHITRSLGPEHPNSSS